MAHFFKSNKILQMFFVIIAGEAIFMIPFLIPRLYRPLMLDAWSLTNTDIGIGFAAYGATSTVSYLFGGTFADKYNPKKLISISLIATALGVFYLVLHPSPTSFIITYALWGISTVFLMWGALIKTTHVIGGESNRSTALGILDSGRGLVAALASTALLFLISHKFSDLTDHKQQLQALRWTYFSMAGFILFIAITVWLSLNNLETIKKDESSWNLKKAINGLKNTKAWLLSTVILSSYCGYKSIDNYSIYLVDVHHFSLTRASEYLSGIIWLRPISALAIGFLADLFQKRKARGRFIVLTSLLFICAVLQTLLAFFGFSHFLIALATIASSASLIYGMRAIYFSVFGDLKIEHHLIGTTVGMVSFVGFLPDIFFGYLCGLLIDHNPGERGFYYAFLFTAACLFAGSLSSFILYRKSLALK